MKQMKRRVSSVILASCLVMVLHAQTINEVLLFPYYKTAVTPAAFPDAKMDFGAMYQNEWIAVKGAPYSIWLNGNMDLDGKERMRVGINAKHDKVVTEARTSFTGDFAYRLRLDLEENFLTFGFRAGFLLASTDPSGLGNDKDYADPALENRSSGHVDFTFAVIADIKRYNFGMYVGSVFPSTDDNGPYKNLAIRPFQLGFHSGARFELSPTLALKPDIHVLYSKQSFKDEASSLRGDFYAAAEFKRMLTFGLYGKTSGMGGVLAGFHRKGISVYYSYAMFLSGLAGGISGWHGIKLGYTLPYPERGMDPFGSESPDG